MAISGGAHSGVFGKRRHRRNPVMSEINVTPMVDVMLVLLIIFMVTAPLLVAGVPVDLPESRAGALDQQAKPVQIALDKNGALFLDDQPVDDATLATRLQDLARTAPDTEIQLRADRAVPYGRIVELMAIAGRAGLTRIGFVAEAPASALAR